MGACLIPKSMGRIEPLRNRAVADFEHLRRRPRRYLVHPVLAMHNHRVSGSQFDQRLRHHGGQPRLGNADQPARGTGGVGNRTEQVEQSSDSELLSNWRHTRHRRMIVRSEKETDSCALQTSPQPRRIEFDPHAESLQHVGSAHGAAGGPVPGLGDFHPGGGCDQRRRRRNIKCAQAVAAGSRRYRAIHRRQDRRYEHAPAAPARRPPIPAAPRPSSASATSRPATR